MIRTDRLVHRQRAVSLYYDMSINSEVNESVLFKGGKHIMALVRYLENHGIRVSLHCMAASTKVNDTVMCDIKIKDAKQAINPQLVSYPITHASFFRRHIFRFFETISVTNNPAWRCFGTPLKDVVGAENMQECLRKKIKGDSAIGQNDYYIDVERCSRVSSIDEMLDMIKLNID